MLMRATSFLVVICPLLWLLQCYDHYMKLERRTVSCWLCPQGDCILISVLNFERQYIQGMTVSPLESKERKTNDKYNTRPIEYCILRLPMESRHGIFITLARVNIIQYVLICNKWQVLLCFYIRLVYPNPRLSIIIAYHIMIMVQMYLVVQQAYISVWKCPRSHSDRWIEFVCEKK